MDLDINSMSVLEILQGMSMEAHGGLEVEGLWEGASTTFMAQQGVSTNDDVPQMSMKFESPQVKNLDYDYEYDWEIEKMYSGDIEQTGLIAEDQYYSGHATDELAPKVSKEELPVGPVSEAILSHGKLMSVARENGEDTNEYDRHFREMWGLSQDISLENFIPRANFNPRTSAIALERDKYSRAYGYPNDQAGMKVSLGAYESSNMSSRRLIDWHRVHTTLRTTLNLLSNNDCVGIELIRKRGMKIWWRIEPREFNKPFTTDFVPPGFVDSSVPNSLKKSMSNIVDYGISQTALRKGLEALHEAVFFRDKMDSVQMSEMEKTAFGQGFLHIAKPERATIPFRSDEAFNSPFGGRVLLPKPARKKGRSRHGGINYRTPVPVVIEKILYSILQKRILRKNDKKVVDWLSTVRHYSEMSDEYAEELPELASSSGVLPKTLGSMTINILSSVRLNKRHAWADLLRWLKTNVGDLLVHPDADVMFSKLMEREDGRRLIMRVAGRAAKKVRMELTDGAQLEMQKWALFSSYGEFQDMLAEALKKRKRKWTTTYKTRLAYWQLEAERRGEGHVGQRLIGKMIRMQNFIKWWPHFRVRFVWANPPIVEKWWDDTGLLKSTYESIEKYARKRKVKEQLKPIEEYVDARALMNWADDEFEPMLKWSGLWAAMNRSVDAFVGDVGEIVEATTERMGVQNQDDDEPAELGDPEWNDDHVAVDEHKHDSHTPVVSTQTGDELLDPGETPNDVGVCDDDFDPLEMMDFDAFHVYEPRINLVYEFGTNLARHTNWTPFFEEQGITDPEDYPFDDYERVTALAREWAVGKIGLEGADDVEDDQTIG